MSKPPVNEDGINYVELKNTLKVLETIRKSCEEEGMQSEAEAVKNVHYFVQLYENGSEWNPAKPSDSVDTDAYQSLGSFERRQD